MSRRKHIFCTKKHNENKRVNKLRSGNNLTINLDKICTIAVFAFNRYVMTTKLMGIIKQNRGFNMCRGEDTFVHQLYIFKKRPYFNRNVNFLLKKLQYTFVHRF